MESDDFQKIIESSFRNILGEDGTGNRAILVKRIPIICQDILSIKADMRWIKWLVMGIAGGIGVLALKTLGI